MNKFTPEELSEVKWRPNWHQQRILHHFMGDEYELGWRITFNNHYEIAARIVGVTIWALIGAIVFHDSFAQDFTGLMIGFTIYDLAHDFIEGPIGTLVAFGLFMILAVYLL